MPDPIAILSSMDQEIREVQSLLQTPVITELHERQFISGSLHGIPVVTAISGYGKVGAAATTSCLLYRFGAKAVIFAGVAGGLDPALNIGDIVIADRLIQHDFDASPIFNRFVIPSLGLAEIPANPGLSDQLEAAAESWLRNRSRDEISTDGQFDVEEMKVRRGLIASGDRFVSSLAEAGSLQGSLPDVLAVEMEGAAVAQVCAERRIPFAVFRSISDRSDSDAGGDFMTYVSSVAAPLTAGVVEEWALARHG